MNLDSIAAGLATAAKTISGMQAESWMPGAVNVLPFFCSVEAEMDYHQSFSASGLVGLRWTVVVFTSKGDSDAGRSLLYSFLPQTGATSLVAALEADSTLGGVCSDLIVDGVQGVGHLYNVGGIDYLGAEWNLRIWGAG